MRSGIVTAPGFEFYSSRSELEKTRPLIEHIKEADEVWAMWNTATMAGEKQIFELGRVRRLLLPDPDGDGIRTLSRTVARSTDALASDVRLATEQAVSRNVEVRWMDHFAPTTLMIGDPETGRGFAHVELVSAGRSPRDKPSFRITEQHHASLFQAFVVSYKAVWESDDLSRPVPVGRESTDGTGSIWTNVGYLQLSDHEIHDLFYGCTTLEAERLIRDWEGKLFRASGGMRDVTSDRVVLGGTVSAPTFLVEGIENRSAIDDSADGRAGGWLIADGIISAMGGQREIILKPSRVICYNVEGEPAFVDDHSVDSEQAPQLVINAFPDERSLKLAVTNVGASDRFAAKVLRCAGAHCMPPAP